MTKRQIETLVRDAWFELTRTCEAYRGTHRPDEYLRRAEEEALEDERQHRAMGRRWTDGKAGYRVSCQVAARAIVLGKVAEGFGFDTISLIGAAELRRDCLLAYAVRQALLEVGTDLSFLRAAAAIDYAKDIAA